MLVVLIVIFSVMSPNYLTLMNFKNVLIQATPLMIVAFGQTCIVLTQGTDLSLGAQVSFVTVFTVWMALRGIPLPAAMLLAILSTTLVGVVNGMIVAKGSIPPFIATYGMQNILNSLSLLLAAGFSIYFPSFTYRIITETMIIGIPLMECCREQQERRSGQQRQEDADDAECQRNCSQNDADGFHAANVGKIII